MPTLIQGEPDAGKKAASRAWRRDLLFPFFIASLCELSLAGAFSPIYAQNAGLRGLRGLSLIFRIGIMVFLPAPILLTPSYFEQFEKRLTARLGDEEDFGVLRKTVGEILGLCYWILFLAL